MAEIDPVILELRAELDAYLSKVRDATTKVDDMLDRQGRNARKLEQEMKRSSTAIGSHIKTLAGTLATYFTGRELVGLLDSFTRLQNNLRVAGLEGEDLEKVQKRLLTISQQYGVNLEALSGVFLKASLAQKELGASTEQMVRLNEITAAALKVTGSSTEQAQGALLQLGQALGAGVVRAEEFNSIIEGALPIAQAAARGIEGMEGSVSKLRSAILEGNITSKQFFEGVLRGGTQTIKDAEKATLTLAGGVEALTSSLTVYFGEADKANGVSAALGTALKTLADNLDILIPALAAVVTFLGVRWVAGAAAAAAGTIAASNAIFALRAAMLGAATAAEALQFALAGSGFGLAALAITAIGAAVFYAASEMETAAQAAERLARETDELAAKNDALADRLREAGIAVDDLGSKAENTSRDINQLSAAMDSAVDSAVGLLRALASVQEAQAEVDDLRRLRARVENPNVLDGPESLGTLLRNSFGGNDDLVRELKAKEREAVRRVKLLSQAVANGIDPDGEDDSGTAGGSGSAAGSGSSKASKSSGPSSAEIKRRFNNELASLAQQAISTEASIVKTVDERAELELRSVELARLRTKADIEADKNYSAAQKKRLLAQLEVVADLEREAIEYDRRRQVEEDALRLNEQRYRNEADQLRVQYDLADTQQERKRLALELVDLEHRYQESMLEAVIASETATEAEKARAQLALEGLRALQAGDRERVARANETGPERYMRDLRRSPEQINEAIDDIKIDGLEALNDGLVDAVRGVKDLGDVFKSVADQIIADLLRIAIQRAIIGPLANAIFGGIGALGGGGGAGISTVFNPGSGLNNIVGARAGGGYVAPGEFYRVNEGAGPGRAEGFMSRDGGQIIPLGEMSALTAPARGGATSITVTVNAKDAVLTQQVKQWVTEGVQVAAQIGTAGGAAEAQRRIAKQRRRIIPG